MSHLALAVFVGVLLVNTSACKKKKVENDNKEAEAAKIPASEKLEFKSKKPCKLDEVVADPEKGTPEHALLHLFQVWKKAKDAKWSGANDEIFEEWRELFERGELENQTRILMSSLGSTLQKGKLNHFVSDKEFAIIVCKKEVKNDSAVKFTVRNDKPKSSNKPITVLKDESGKWKINKGSILLY